MAGFAGRAGRLGCRKHEGSRQRRVAESPIEDSGYGYLWSSAPTGMSPWPGRGAMAHSSHS